MSGRELVDRWTTAQGRRLAEDAAFCLVSGESFLGSEIPIHEGRVDLRGFSLPAPERIGGITSGRLKGKVVDGLFSFRGTTWKDLDLSFARLESLRFFDANVVNCVFDRVNARDWRLWNSTVESSSFQRADLRDAGLGTWWEERSNTWDHVTFESADLRGATFQVARLIACDFSGSKLGSMQFSQCVLQGVKFKGVLEDMFFDSRGVGGRPDPGPMVDVDFSESTFRYVDFRGCRFESASFPNDPGLRLIPFFPKVARREIELLDGDTSLEARQIVAVLENELRMPGREDSTGVFVRDDWARDGGEELAGLAQETLMRALQEVGGSATPSN